MMGNKVCRDCKQSLPVIMFAVCRHVKDGLQTYCRSCDNKRGREHRLNHNPRPKHRLRHGIGSWYNT